MDRPDIARRIPRAEPVSRVATASAMAHGRRAAQAHIDCRAWVGR